MVSTAPTCGLTKGGRTLRAIDPTTGKRIQKVDPDTGQLVDAIDDRLLDDMIALQKGTSTDTLTFVLRSEVELNTAVPVYYDRTYHDRFEREIRRGSLKGFTSSSLQQLLDDGMLEVRNGHGSPSQEERIGDIPYIKVSDLRAGLVNINPTNRVPRSVARKFWNGESSGLRAFDLVCPERTSKNIGDFCVLMPGQEQVLMTKEMIILRPGANADFDPFYILWAMTLSVVRAQWKRIVFMQTNREDVGKRYLEIEIPIAKSAHKAAEVSKAFREYYFALAKSREALSAYLRGEHQHHFFVSGADENI